MNKNAKIYYLRDRRTARVDKKGVAHRPNPVAVVATEIDRQSHIIRYAVAMVRDGETFTKEFARRIVLERLFGFKKGKDNQDILEKPKSARKGNAPKNCAGARTITFNQLSGGSLTSPAVIRTPLPDSGHELTALVMKNISVSSDFPDKIRDLAKDWLTHKEEMDVSDRLPTIPCPPPTKPEIFGSGDVTMEEAEIPPPPPIRSILL